MSIRRGGAGRLSSGSRHLAGHGVAGESSHPLAPVTTTPGRGLHLEAGADAGDRSAAECVVDIGDLDASLHRDPRDAQHNRWPCPSHSVSSGSALAGVRHAHNTSLPDAGSRAMVEPSIGALVFALTSSHRSPIQRHVVSTVPGEGSPTHPTAMCYPGNRVELHRAEEGSGGKIGARSMTPTRSPMRPGAARNGDDARVRHQQHLAQRRVPGHGRALPRLWACGAALEGQPGGAIPAPRARPPQRPPPPASNKSPFASGLRRLRHPNAPVGLLPVAEGPGGSIPEPGVAAGPTWPKTTTWFVATSSVAFIVAE